MSENISITGVPTTPGQNGSVPIRREIRDLQSNYADQFNLFLLGIKAFQEQDEEALTSYYQVAGIHGMPFKPWDGVQGSQDWQPDEFGGYCTHSSVLFTTWHRPYLALFEQALFAAVQGIAQQFPASMRDKYVEAANSFRLPYFDWAMVVPSGSSAFPSAISSPKIQVVDTDGQTKQIDNPLYQFAFHPVNPQPDDFDDQWSQFPETLRYPNRKGQSQDAMVARVLANENDSLRSNVALILLSYTDFDAFSNNAWAGTNPPGTYGSLEDIHNEIHDKVGGPGGHMGALEVAAFDPVFWLHHCNVDRLFALWQGLNPDSFITPEPLPDAGVNLTTDGGTVESQDYPLFPFWDVSGTNFWTSAQVRDTATFGYAYPETQIWNYASLQEYQQTLRQTVSQEYGGNTFNDMAMRFASVPKPAAAVQKPPGQSPLVKAAPPITAQSQTGNGSAQAAPRVTSNTANTGPISTSLAQVTPSHHNVYTEWLVNVRALKHGLGQTFRVLVFLGDINPDPYTWNLEPNCVGRVSVLGRSPGTGCGKCRRDTKNGLSVTGTVPLTSALRGAAGLAGLDAAHVVPYLKKHLSWRVTVFDGSEKPVSEVPGLEVSVCSTLVTRGDDGTPHYSGEYTVYREVTAGMPGGLGTEDAA